MRELVAGDVLDVRAIAGLHVVALAWDFADGANVDKDRLQGFAVERSELDAAGDVVERYFLRGIKRYQHKDEGVPPGTPVPLSEHPVQSFQWGDYTAKPGTTYRYRVVPVYGEPKLLDLDVFNATEVEVTTESEQGGGGPGGIAGHDIYFNRGPAGSQAYARKFTTKPDETQPASEQMRWLSRGLFEALVAFIERAAGPDADEYQLRAMLYEFRYLPVGQAFARARDAGADVDVRYESQTYKDENEEMIAQAGIEDITTPQRSRGGIRHNKFIVLIHNGTPVGVWTGSTNISAGGIFGHSNVGHAIWDQAVAQRYLDYWTRLAADDVTRAPLLHANIDAEATPGENDPAPDDHMLTLFSPRDDEDDLPTLHWYAARMRAAERIVCVTFAFSLDEVFEEVLLERNDILRYAVLDKRLDPDTEDAIDHVGNTVIAAGAKLEKGDLVNFVGESLTGFNRNLYIHDKFLLVDPLGDDPLVVTGSANFSPSSQSDNDENMLVIRGSQRVADIYFGEYMRVFDHLYARYLVRKIAERGDGNPDAGYLKETSGDWLPAHFRFGRKNLRRRYFMGR
jgi:phosphatidylserine/phosphatidylglycerophosphate/cardiolipin synthase-like enzyme